MRVTFASHSTASARNPRTRQRRRRRCRPLALYLPRSFLFSLIARHTRGAKGAGQGKKGHQLSRFREPVSFPNAIARKYEKSSRKQRKLGEIRLETNRSCSGNFPAGIRFLLFFQTISRSNLEKPLKAGIVINNRISVLGDAPAQPGKRQSKSYAAFHSGRKRHKQRSNDFRFSE